MKKMLILALVLIAVPAMAAVNFDVAADSGTNQITVSFDNSDAENVRAFALDIELSSGTIVSVDSVNGEYTIYPGSIVIEEGAVTDAGSAVADASYPGTKDGVGSNAMTIEMGSLYAADETAPAQNDIICVFTVSEQCESLTITENAIRGGVVMEDPEVDPTTNAGSFNIEWGGDACPMDLNGDNYVSPDDVQVLITELSPHAADGYWVPTDETNEHMDLNGDNYVSPDDLQVLITELSPHAADGYWVECP